MLNNVVNFSGGKDSTAMLLMMLERGENIHSVVFFDGGWEYPQMLEHLEKVEEYIGLKIIKLKPEKDFDYWLIKHPVKKQSGEYKGCVHRIGKGWPSATMRWCTGIKARAINRYTKSVGKSVNCIGFAANETKRSQAKGLTGTMSRFPLIEFGVNEAQALEYCLDRGFDWGGLYDNLARVSCYCCPLQRIGELRTLRTEYPELWRGMMQKEKLMKSNRGFRRRLTVHDLDEQFRKDDIRARFLDYANIQIT